MDKVYVGLKAIAKRMGVRPTDVLCWHKECGFPISKVPVKGTKTWTTSNSLIYEWERNMVKLSWRQQFN